MVKQKKTELAQTRFYSLCGLYLPLNHQATNCSPPLVSTLYMLLMSYWGRNSQKKRDSHFIFLYELLKLFCNQFIDLL